MIAIFDIGKTNKKIFIFDEHYHIVWEKTTELEQTTDEDGDECEDLELLTHWVRETLTEIMHLPEFNIKAINFTSYGASFVHIDSNGVPLTPLYNYLKPYPPALQQAFYAQYGGEQEVSAATASPVLGSLNSGMQLYRLKKEQPALFKRIAYSLHLPQFLSYLVADFPCTDITSIGCHTQLWDFTRNDYHHWVKAEGVDRVFADILPSDAVIPTTIHGVEIPVGGGLHDSSSALIPYLTGFSAPFLLISTGTWCISLNPFNANPLTKEELAQDSLCYIEYHGKPVKASRIFAGNEHEQQVKRIADHFGEPTRFYRDVVFDPDLLMGLPVAPPFVAAEPGTLAQSVFPHRDLSLFSSAAQAYHCLIADIMEQQKISTGLVIQDTGVQRIFVDGGFSKNPVYMHLLAAAFPELEVFAASVAQATAVGAAIAIHKHWNSKALPGDLIEMKYYTVTQQSV